MLIITVERTFGTRNENNMVRKIVKISEENATDAGFVRPAMGSTGVGKRQGQTVSTYCDGLAIGLNARQVPSETRGAAALMRKVIRP